MKKIGLLFTVILPTLLLTLTGCLGTVVHPTVDFTWGLGTACPPF
jgi:hypothetical protein